MIEGSPSASERESAPDPAPAPVTAPRKEWLMPLATIAVAMIVLTILSTSAVLWMGGGTSQPSYAPGTPEAAMQEFVDAYKRGDYVTVDSYLSSRLKSEGITTKMGGGLGTSGAELTVTITSARVNGDRATLDVQITRSSNSFLGNTSSSYGASVDLVREGGSWKIDSENVVFL